MTTTDQTKRSILIVDDEKAMRRLTEIYIAKHSEHVITFLTVSDGREAIELYILLDIKPDLVIMDLCMPYMNGVEATERILKYDPCAVVWIFTAYYESEMEERALAAGAKGVISKSADWDDVATKFISILEGEKQNGKKSDSKGN